MGLFRKKKKTEQISYGELCSGLTMADPVTMGEKPRLSEAWAWALIEALFAIGTAGAFLSCLELTYYGPLLFIFYIGAAAYLGHIHYIKSRFRKDMAYLLYFGLYLFLIISLRAYVNSGFYAVVNTLYEKGSDYFGLSAERVVTETITNRALTITIMATFVGLAVMLLLNICLPMLLEIKLLVFLAVSVMLFPLFFNMKPDLFYVTILFGCILWVVVQKTSGHFGEKNRDSEITFLNKKSLFFYGKNGRVMTEFMAVTMAVSILAVSLCSMFVPQAGYTYGLRTSSVKKDLEQPIQTLMVAGIMGLINRYDAKGGVNGGMLGGVSSIRPDYEADFIVTYAPYDYNPIYLKAFVGEYYEGTHWTADEAPLFEQPVGGANKAKMILKNMDANTKYPYLPYYTEVEGDLPVYFPIGEEREYVYYPDNEEGITTSRVKDSYLAVPEKNLKTIMDFCAEAGISGDPRTEIRQVINYFAENYPYTMSPGATPRNKDFVNFFLEKNKKGYCAHFASSATLIFRYLGIPSRYVEGYIISASGMLEANLREDLSYDDFYEGEAPIGRTAVIEAEVPDANGHAWVEVFLNGRWEKVEVTPPAREEEEEQDFWSIFGNWMASRAGDEEGEEDNPNLLLTNQLFSIGKVYFIRFFYIIVGLFFARFFFIRIRRIFKYHKKDKTENLVAYYQYICNYMRMADKEFDHKKNHFDQLLWMNISHSEEEIRRLAEGLSQASYRVSGIDTTRYSIEALRESLKEIFKAKKKQFSVVKRFVIFWK